MLKKYSLLVLIITGVILSAFRLSNVSKKELSWDVLGYYMPLPSTFIYDDPLLNNYDWLKKINTEQNLSNTLYMVSSNDKKEPMYFFLLGSAILYLPFFLIGHFMAFLLGFPMDGFSAPYQYAMVVGGVLFTLIGLYYFRKVLRNHFSELIASVVLLTVVFSTNYIHHLTIKNLETVNLLFMFVSMVIWYTIQWHKEQKFKYLLMVCASISFMALVKPSEIVIVLIPLLWNVTSFSSLKDKLSLLAKHKGQILKAVIICFFIGLPQMSYWLIKTGMPIYDSYKNPGVGLDLFSPHIMESLFSYRKGWLLYTPVMLFFLAGFPLIFKNNKAIFLSVASYFIFSLWIITSWSEWWYGAGFSNRPLISTYPVLAIAFGYFIIFLKDKNILVKSFIVIIAVAFTFLNQFQWWQQKNGILDPYRTTKDYYWAIFLKQEASAADREKLLVYRDFTGKFNFKDRDKYSSKNILSLDFENDDSDNIKTDSAGNKYYLMKAKQPFAFTNHFEYRKLTQNKHIWVTANADIKFSDNFTGQNPCMVFTMKRKEGLYNYSAQEIRPDKSKNDWRTYSFDYLTPEIRSTSDTLMFYIWKRGESTFAIDNFSIDVFEKK